MLQFATIRFAILVLWFSTPFYAKFTSLEDFLRVSSSIDPNETSIEYINGTVYGRLAGSRLMPLFWFEGYNINRKVPEEGGDWLSLSREFLVYRDFHTRQILEVFINPFTSIPNEVFPVANDPVNGRLSKDVKIPYKLIPGDVSVYDSNYILEYPNPLDPTKYPKYSAGKFYNSAELFTYYANHSELANTDKPSVNHINTWSRHSQFLPWFEMGQTEGSLFYATLAWKCVDGLQCITKDILDLIKQKYHKFLTAPAKYEIPNDTSWTVFKETIDQRRKLNLPDIIIPAINISTHASYDPHVDPRLIRLLSQCQHQISFNASLRTQIVGTDSIRLPDMKGLLKVKTMRNCNGFYQLILTGAASYFDPQTTNPIKNWINPITNKTVSVPTVSISEKWDLAANKSYSTYISALQTSGLTVTDDKSRIDHDSGGEYWSVSLAQFIFPEAEITKPNPHFYGTYHRYGSWFKWMELDGIDGVLVLKAIFSN